MSKMWKRFTTYERVEKFDISIIKKDGSLERFDSSKIVKGIRKAVDEERVTCDDVDLFAEELERYVLNSEEPVKSHDIGLMVLEWLKSKDPLSYIRFASVYKKFDDLEDIEAEIKSLKNT